MIDASPSRMLRTTPLLLIMAALCPLAHGKVIYVDDDVAGANDGTSWANAYVHLQDALADANERERPVEIHVAGGIYKPDQGSNQTRGDREATFQLIGGVTLRGGYAGVGGTDPNARDIETFETILSGDLNGDDAEVADPCDLPNEPTHNENSCHIVTGSGTDMSAVLDGFTITAGNADGSDQQYEGGGMYNSSGSPTLTDCTFSSNSALRGGAVSNWENSNPTLTNCRFFRNWAKYGAAVKNNFTSSPTLTNCRFTENSAESGGGMDNGSSSNPELVDCTFSRNRARVGGGMRNASLSSPTLTNCTFTSNASVYGGAGMYNDSGSSLTLTNCTFTGNTSDGGSAGMFNDDSNLTLKDCIFSENSAGAGGGGGMGNEDSNLTLTNCTFSANSAPDNGGGGMVILGSTLILTNCTFTANSAWRGGGMASTPEFAGQARLTLTNCTFTGNLAVGKFGRGGGMYCSTESPGEAELTMTNCTFMRNLAAGEHGRGGGIYSSIDSPTLTNCIFSENSAAGSGGAIYNDDGRPQVSNCRFSGNSAGSDGGGLYNVMLTEPFPYGPFVGPTLTNCTFSGNLSRYGGAIYNQYGSRVDLMNCILWGNTADYGSQVCLAGATSALVVEYSNLQGGRTAIPIADDAIVWGPGNIDVDPGFVQAGYWILPTPRQPGEPVWIEGDYHLKSQAGRWDPAGESWVIDDVSSPCIDAGDPNSPVAFEPFPNGGRVNVGAYGGSAEASKSLSGLHARYGGGTGEPNDPYLIYTAEHLNAIGANPDDLDKHFKLMADIDLGVYWGDSFNVIGSYRTYRDTPFSGVFDGNGKKISGFTYTSTDADNIGLFGRVEGETAVIKNLGLINPSINAATGSHVGSLVGDLWDGSIFNCYAEGASVSGDDYVGGLVGRYDVVHAGFCAISHCYATGSVSGKSYVGGLTGYNPWRGTVANCYSTASVSGNDSVGGLVGRNDDQITNCYATGSVSADVPGQAIGGLAGWNDGLITNCYAAGRVSGPGWVGPLVGRKVGGVKNSFWDAETSGVPWDTAGMRKSTAEMTDPNTFIAAGWDFVGEFENGPNDDWAEPAGGGYPVLSWQLAESQLPPLPRFSGGTGTADDPYLISTANQLNCIGHNPRLVDAQFKLVDDIDLGGVDLFTIGDKLSPFTGVFDGNNRIISNFSRSIETDNLGLFGCVNGDNAQIKDVGIVDPNLSGAAGALVHDLQDGTVSGCCVDGGTVKGGGLVGTNKGTIVNCTASASVSGTGYTGGLVSSNSGAISNCAASASVSGTGCVGGLVGYNGVRATITCCYSVGSVLGEESVGGLVGFNAGIVTGCYSTGAVTGNEKVGGLVGYNVVGAVFACYSSGTVSGTTDVGGLIGIGSGAPGSYWDIQTSGLSTSDGGAGKTTAEMQTASTFVGWGCDPVWTIDEGKDYPRLWWENMPGEVITTPSPFEAVAGAGTQVDPYLIYTAQELNMIGQLPYTWDKRFKLMADIDLSAYTGTAFNIIGRYSWPFSGVFDGNGKRVANFSYTSPATNAVGLLGLFRCVRRENAQIKNLGLLNPNIDAGTGVTVGALVGLLTGGGTVSNCYAEGGSVRGSDYVGGLVGENWGTITGCYATGSVSGQDWGIGGLAGISPGSITNCYARGSISGTRNVGGLTGNSADAITNSYAAGTVSGSEFVGGLVGNSWGSITHSYATGSVAGDTHVGGLAGRNTHTITYCYSTGSVIGASDVGGLVGGGNGRVMLSFWNTQTSGQAASDGGTPKTTAEMQTASTFLEAGWDFVDETDNGTEDIWWVLEGQDYPRLWWERGPEMP